jgi:predicted transcriptional regulator
MEITDLPTLFQIASAQESNARHLEVVDNIIESQQVEIERLKKIINVQQDLLEEITHWIKAKS